MEIVEDFAQDVWNSDIESSLLCRVCANPNDYLIPIFQGEGLEHELQHKIIKHLPIKVSEDDKLPTQLCYQCASTIIAWHDLVAACIEAEEKFNSLLNEDGQSTFLVKDEIPNENCNSKYRETQSNGPIQEEEMNEEIEIEDEEILYNSSDGHQSIMIEEVKTMAPQSTEEVHEEFRSQVPFYAYHQTQTALKTLEWVNNGCLFCILCGEQKKNHTMLIKHLSMEHTMRCGHCRACFANEEQLSAHMIKHGSKDKGDQCDTFELQQKCKMSRNNKSKTHDTKLLHQTTCVLRKENNKDSFQCNMCLLPFSSKFDIKKHKLRHHFVDKHSNGKENSNFLSDSCEVILTNNLKQKTVVKDRSDSEDSVNSEEISRHLDVKSTNSRGSIDLLSHSSSRNSCNFGTNQEICVYQQNENPLEQQVERDLKSNPNKQFSCSLCNNLYSRRSDLQKHISKKHGSDKLLKRCVNYVDDMDVDVINQAKQNISGIIVYRCNYCGKNMRTRRGYVRHVRVHTGERPFTCHICGKQYRSNADLTRHLRCVHDGVKNYQCDICGRYFASKGTRNDHRRTHTGEKPYVCHVCGKSFPTPNSIYVHRRVHTDHFPHSCTSCDKKFRRKQQLINHLRTHTGEKPHTCDICGKCFCTKDEVSRHKFTHSNDKPHICSVCGIRFGQKRYLTNHMKTNHLFS